MEDSSVLSGQVTGTGWVLILDCLSHPKSAGRFLFAQSGKGDWVLIGKSGRVDVDMFEAERLALLHRSVSQPVMGRQWCMTYNNEPRSLYFSLAVAKEVFNLVTDTLRS